jgi:hypothetical protein
MPSPSHWTRVALAIAAWLSSAGVVQALSIVELEFTSTTGAGTPGGSAIQAAPGDDLTLAMYLSVGSEGVSSYGISILFDEDLLDELDVVEVTEHLPAGLDFHFTPAIQLGRESNGLVVGRLLTFEAATIFDGPTGERFRVATVVFRVTDRVASDGDDVRAGLFNPGIDGIFSNSGSDISPTLFPTARVDFIPEPTTGVLLAAGLLCLAAARRLQGMEPARPSENTPCR